MTSEYAITNVFRVRINGAIHEFESEEEAKSEVRRLRFVAEIDRVLTDPHGRTSVGGKLLERWAQVAHYVGQYRSGVELPTPYKAAKVAKPAAEAQPITEPQAAKAITGPAVAEADGCPACGQPEGEKHFVGCSVLDDYMAELERGERSAKLALDAKVTELKASLVPAVCPGCGSLAGQPHGVACPVVAATKT